MPQYTRWAFTSISESVEHRLVVALPREAGAREVGAVEAVDLEVALHDHEVDEGAGGGLDHADLAVGEEDQLLSEKDVRLAQKMLVGPHIPVGIQL
jgi:hypothetical protein